MKIALWIIAVCEVVRIAENAMLLISSAKTQEKMNKAYDSISQTEVKLNEETDKMRDEIIRTFSEKCTSQDTYSAMESDKDVV